MSLNAGKRLTLVSVAMQTHLSMCTVIWKLFIVKSNFLGKVGHHEIMARSGQFGSGKAVAHR